jgi:hypothetical protein
LKTVIDSIETYEYVFRLDISVNNVTTMKVVQCIDYIIDHTCSLMFTKTSTTKNFVEEVTALNNKYNYTTAL